MLVVSTWGAEQKHLLCKKSKGILGLVLEDCEGSWYALEVQFAFVSSQAWGSWAS